MTREEDEQETIEKGRKKADELEIRYTIENLLSSVEERKVRRFESKSAFQLIQSSIPSDRDSKRSMGGRNEKTNINPAKQVHPRRTCHDIYPLL